MVDIDSEGEELVSLLSEDQVQDGSRVAVRRQFELPTVVVRNGWTVKARPTQNGVNSNRSRVESGQPNDGGVEQGEDFGTIDWRYYRAKARTHNQQVQRSIRGWPAPFRAIYSGYDAMQTWVALGVIGASCGVIASIIDISTDWATDVKFGFCKRGFWINRATCCSDSSDMLTCPSWYSWAAAGGDGAMLVYVLVAVAMGSYSAWLGWLSPYAKGSGMPEGKVILGGFVINRFLDGWTLLAKSLGLILAVGSGMSIGKEGPFVHVCMFVCNLCTGPFAKFRSNEGRKRELLSCAAAAGVGVAFGAPIGGVLFSLEEVSSYFPPKTMWRSFWCAIVAVLTMQGLNRNGSGKLVMFEVHYHHQWKWFEIVPFALLGVIGGLLGALFIKAHTALLRRRAEWAWAQNNPVTEVVILASITSVLHYHIVYLQASCTGLLAALFADCQGPQAPAHQALCRDDPAVAIELILAAALKLLLTIVTATAPVPGGLLIPSLAIGGMVGRAAGLWVQRAHAWIGDAWLLHECSASSTCVTPGVYAIVGAAAVLGGVTRMTVCLVVIMFEITGGLEYILPIMTAVMVSKWVGDALGKGSVYDKAIALKGYPYLDNKAEFAHTDKVAKHVMSPNQMEAIELEGNTVHALSALLQRCPLQGFPVVSSHAEALIAGYITRRALQKIVGARGEEVGDVEAGLGEAQGEGAAINLKPWFDVAPINVDEDAPLDGVVDMFFALGLRYVLVTRHGRLLGIIKKKDLLAHIGVPRREEA